MRGRLLQSPPRTSYKSTTDTLTHTAALTVRGMVQEAQTPLPPPGALEDPVSIIVVDEAPKGSLAAIFSFNSPGGFTWWAGAILAVLGCCAFASIVIIQVETNRREPPAVMALMATQQCPFLSSLLPPLAFEAWRSTCARVAQGAAYPCTSSADCLGLGGRCADPLLLAKLQCVYTGVGADPKRKVCAYPSVNTTATSSTVPTPGFCPNTGTTCALCLGGSCGATTLSAGSIGCPSTSACSGSSWMCHPLNP